MGIKGVEELTNTKAAIVTGAAGFTGTALTEQLIKNGYFVYAIVRYGSEHNERLNDIQNVRVIETKAGDYEVIKREVDHPCDVLFHLMWTGERGIEGQNKNIQYTLNALKAAAECGCRRFVATGSQTEYGVVPSGTLQTEDMQADPFTPYGKAKVEACHKSKSAAREFGIEWVWGRIFSLIGRYEPSGRMLPDLYRTLKDGRDFSMSSGRQNWDYLDVYDAADALIALNEEGISGEIYNIANGAYRPLKEYTEQLKSIVGTDGTIYYGADPDPFISLQPSVKKLMSHTDWKPKRSFEDSIREYE